MNLNLFRVVRVCKADLSANKCDQQDIEAQYNLFSIAIVF